MTARGTERSLTRRGFLAGAAIGAGALGWSAGRGAPAAEPRKGTQRPNFLVIVADDMGFSDAGCYGGEIATPNLDKLAAGGVRFTQMYSTGRCWPSRACILTGYYAQQVRMDPPRGRLPAWTRLAPHYLKPMGYRCYHSGKWHIRGAPMPVRDGGFDRSYFLGDQDRFFSPRRHWLDDKPLPAASTDEGYYATTEIADRAIAHLKDHGRTHAGRPFFQYLAFTCPHFPLHALQKDIARYRGRYARGWDSVRAGRRRRGSGARTSSGGWRPRNSGKGKSPSKTAPNGQARSATAIAWEAAGGSGGAGGFSLIVERAAWRWYTSAG